MASAQALAMALPQIASNSHVFRRHPASSFSYRKLGSISSRIPAGGKERVTKGFTVVSEAKSDADAGGSQVGVGGYAAIGGGLIAVPVVAWSLYTLKTTGCGLPPGPGGSIGALEGVSFLVVFGVVGWSVYTKVKTGSGLPSGPFGLLGAVEGLSYLTILAILVVFGLQFLDYGFIPGPVPGEQCFG